MQKSQAAALKNVFPLHENGLQEKKMNLLAQRTQMDYLLW